MIRVLDRTFEPYIDQSDIDDKVQSIAEAIGNLYGDLNPVILVILNGAFRFAGDLSSHIDFPCDWQFVKLSSYEGMQSTGDIKESATLSIDLENRHIIIVEDIIDTGNTMSYYLEKLNERKPASVFLVSLFIKPDVLQGRIEPDLVGFSIPNKFIIGYGLDYNEKGRNLNGIWQVKEV